MTNIILRNTLSTEDKINMMREDSRFDVADTELFDYSGNYDEISIPDPTLFNDIKAGKKPVSPPKTFLSGSCIFNCAYCGCRVSNEKVKYCCTPRELAEISVKQARENNFGIFISSAIFKNADYTEELIIEALRIIRKELFFDGYVHAKVMPGTDPLLIEKAGKYADRLSVNIEVAKSEGYERVAKQKSKQNILTPMKQISDLIQIHKQNKSMWKPKFATSQTTQLMAGSTEESDRTIMVLSKAMYKKYKLKRVYYTAFQYRNHAKGYDLPLTSVSKWRVRRLYQADRMMELYGFTPDEITPEDMPDLPEEIDPKINWAIRNINLFPMEVNTASYEELLRIPGIGLTYAKKIMRARKYYTLTHDILDKIGVSLKRSRYFITCNGKYSGGNLIDDPKSLYNIFAVEAEIPVQMKLPVINEF